MPAKFDPKIHHRRSIRLKDYDYAELGAYFVTIVTRQRACLFGDVVDGSVVLNKAGRIVDECWMATPTHFDGTELITHVIMPKHVHGIVVIRDIFEPIGVSKAPRLVGARHASPLRPHGVKEHSLGAIIGSFKSAVTKRIGRELSPIIVWQRNYYEHIVRDERQMKAAWLYIESNPFTWATDDENPARESALAR